MNIAIKITKTIRTKQRFTNELVTTRLYNSKNTKHSRNIARKAKQANKYMNYKKEA